MFLPSHSSNCDGFPQLLFKKLPETIVRKLWFGTEHLLSSASAGRELWRHAHSQLKTSRPCAASHQFLPDLSLPYHAPPYPVTLRVYGRYAKERTNCLHFVAAAICIIRSVYKARNAPWKLRVKRDGSVTSAARAVKRANSVRTLQKTRKAG